MNHFSKITLGLATVALLSSCRTESPTEKTKIENLKPVAFSSAETKTLSTEKTGETRYNSNISSVEFEYLTVVEKNHTLSPLSFVDARNIDVIYPGSILRGDSFMNGNYDPLVVKTGYNDVMLSVSLRGKNLPVKASSKPILSEIRNTTNTLVAQNKSEIDYSFVPGYINYQSDKVNTEKSFNKSLNIHVNADVLKGLVSAKFNYDDSYKSSKSTNYVMVKLNQIFYSASIDPKHYSEWFADEVDAKDFGTHEPVYVSNVDYGRVAYLLIETTKSEEETKRMISGAVNFAFKAATIGAGFSYNRELKDLFSQSKIRVIIAGGPAKLAGQVDNYNSFIEFIKTPTVEDLVSSATPISYKVRRLRDNTEIEVKQRITEKVLEYKAN